MLSSDAGGAQGGARLLEYSVCIEMVFGGTDYLDKIRKVREAGFGAFEFWSWWDKDLDAVTAAAKENGLAISAICAKPASLTEPSGRQAFVEALRSSVDAARRVGARSLIAQTGQDTGADRGLQWLSVVSGLKAAAPMLERAGLTLLVEPLNTIADHKGYFLWSSSEAYDIVDAVGSPSVKVLFDIYHQQIMEGNLISNIAGGIGRIGHFHAAGNPGRHDPFDGEINYPEVLKAIGKMGYSGYIGLEYSPLGDPIESLARVRKDMPI
ncbi:MAG: TIM barrel protein [Clostridiales bacterium]|jgi:hydroxypyruvate isomerase|nr:TIM barrel protein [Clostridiales bacterium]